MRIKDNLSTGAEARRGIPLVLLIVVGPLLGLVYVIVLPLVAVVSFIFLFGYRVKQVFDTTWHRLLHASAHQT